MSASIVDSITGSAPRVGWELLLYPIFFLLWMMCFED